MRYNNYAQYLNEWMNEFLKKEHTRPPRACEMRSPPQGAAQPRPYLHVGPTAMAALPDQASAGTFAPWLRKQPGIMVSASVSALTFIAMPRLRSLGELRPVLETRHVHAHFTGVQL